MSQLCQITKKQFLCGNNRSHAMNATKRKFMLNLHIHRFWFAKKNKFIKLKLSVKGMRIINKKGIKKILYNYYNKNK
ncbi:MAG: 50S ribosomal protein L28 [gamma proteobacterium endosymbiont of Trioza apicalis]